MNVARKNPTSCVYDGKIYVIGGLDRLLLSGEVFDIKTQTWEHLHEPGFEITYHLSYNITEFEGKIYFRTEYMMHAYYDLKQCKWEKKSAMFPSSNCVIDNVSYSFKKHGGGRYNFWWSYINGVESKEVKGLDSLGNRYKRHGGSSNSTTKVISCGGKLYVMWEGYTRNNDMVNICCAEISVEKRDGDEIWGNVEWLDVIHSSPTHHLLHCLAISV